MDRAPHTEASHRWSPAARRLGIVSASAVAGVGVLYVGVIALWLVVEATPRAPIGDPYLAVMEGLTILSALGILGLILALWRFVEAARRLFALATLLFGSFGAVLTLAVHFVQLTAVRQLWQAGQLSDYRLIWPSMLFAVEYLAWDVLVGLTMACAGLALPATAKAVSARRALLGGGALCLVGVIGPLSGWMLVQNVAVFGYAIVLPVAAALLARLFYTTPSGASPP
jgi:hypothetical protein